MTDYLGDLGRIASDNAATYSMGSPVSSLSGGNQHHGFDDAAVYGALSPRVGTAAGAGNSSESKYRTTGTAEGRAAAPTLVADVRAGVSRMRFAPYIKNFDEEAAAAAIAMCSVPVQTVEDAARAQLLTFDIQREDQSMRYRNELIKVAELRRNRLTELDQKRHEHHTLQLQSLRAIGLVQQQTADLVSTYYDLAEREMEIHLTSRKGEVQRTIGEIRKWHYSDYDPNKPDWNSIGQEVQIQVCKLRGVKNKVPRGRYVVLMSKWEKLGLDAAPLNWAREGLFDAKPPKCPIHGGSRNIYEKLTCEVCCGVTGCTAIHKHEGLATDYEIQFGSHSTTKFPAADEIKPFNVLVFELARLPEVSEWREDQPFRPTVVGWAAMPIVDSKFEVVNGKFRIPMLRGPYKPEFGHYYAIQDAILGDIENWLCNLYIDIYPHARDYYGQSEFDLERAFTRNLLRLEGYKSAHDSEGWPLEKRKRGLSAMGGGIDPLTDFRNRTAGAAAGLIGAAARSAKASGAGGTMRGGAGATAVGGLRGGAGGATMAGAGLGGTRANQTMTNTMVMGGTTTMGAGTTFGMFDDEEFPYVRPAHVAPCETAALTRWALLRTAVWNHIEAKRAHALEAQRDAIKRVEQQKRFRYAIHPLGAANLRSVWSIQVEYCYRAILDDLNWFQPLTWGFWGTVLIFVISLLFQVYVHGLFVYFALYITGTPVQTLEPRWYGLNVVYSHLKTYQVEELFVVFASMLSTYFFLICEILLGWALRAAIAHTPEKLSKFVFTTALSAMLVPVIEICIDAGSGGTLRRSDWYRLDAFFTLQEYGSYYTGLIWFLLYALLLFGSVVTTFLYTMRLHLNGILQDAFWRIMYVNESTCFLPDDLEISVSELQHILLHAERWRGKGGERRKIIVERLTTTDATDPEYKREDMHIRVVQLDCGGGGGNGARRWWLRREQKVHREFFITQDGTVLELMAGEGGGSQGMQGAAIGIGFLLNTLANTMSKKNMEAWKGVLGASSSGIGAGGVGGAGGGMFGEGGEDGGGFFGLGGGVGVSASPGARSNDLDGDEDMDEAERRGAHLRGATANRVTGGRFDTSTSMDFAADFSNSFY